MRVITPVLMAGAALALVSATVLPARAQTVVYDGNSYAADQGFTLFFNGVSDPDGSPVTGLGSQLDLVFRSTDGLNWNFDFEIINRSEAPHTSSRVTAFGFDTDPYNPIISSSSEDSDYGRVSAGSIANSFSVDFCLIGSPNGGPTCAGGANIGPLPGNSIGGSFSMAFGNSMDALTLSDFHTRYQSTANSSGSASGNVISSVPEPGTWAMMLFGFAGVGAAMRRRRQLVIRTLTA